MSNTDVAEYYRRMRLIRRVEERMMELKTAGEVPGSIHLCNGQEAIPVGFCSHLGGNDWVTATYRGHGWALAKGTDVTGLFAEVMGKDSAVNGGRSASPFLSDPGVGFLGENSIVGAGVPIALGASLTAQRKRTGGVSVVSIGDGALNQGNVHEALNMAAVMTSPLVIVVENNVYSEMSPIVDMVKIDELSERGAAYGIPAETIDGNDIDAVVEAAGRAIGRARNGEGPTIVECKTARLVGHYSGDVQHYRPKGEVAEARKVEPLVRVREAHGDRTADFDRIDTEVDEQVEAAIEAARNTPTPDPATVKDHIHV
ncbi:thiamine pyrophosphate-dependent dehydrogenase E1 component subunit alpha [Propionibacteriaceae bacterium Y2011]